MWLALGYLGLTLTVQIPPPAIGPNTNQDLKANRREILERENTLLSALADRLDRERNGNASRIVRALIFQATDSDSLTRFKPLPEVVPGRKTSSVSETEAWKTEVEKIRRETSTELIDLARRAASASPPQWGLASECVRDALEHDPNQPEARRLLGFEPYEGGWARPFAIQNLRGGKVLHPTYGWVPSTWVSKLEGGLLPAPNRSKDPNKARWLPAAEADRLRADGSPPWIITTEHFQIQSNVPLSETILFGRRLEAFHELFYTVMADAIGNDLPLARRFRDPSSHGVSTYRPHLVHYFATKDQYLGHLRNIAPPDIDQSLGYYDPPGPGQKNRKPAYFFRDEGGQIEATATLYHEVSHQLLFESGGGNSYRKNEGNYWVFEGLGTFFETVTTHADGSMEVGGFVGPRIEEAVKQIVHHQAAMPTGLFVGLRMEIFNLRGQIYANYQQAMALTLFLMRWNDGVYRDAFLGYVRDALKGNLRPNLTSTLQDRLGEPYETIDAQFLEFLKARNVARHVPKRSGSVQNTRQAAPAN